MLKFIQNTRIPSIVFGSAALMALISVSQITPAAAQGVPAGLLRLDSSKQALDAQASLAEVQQPKVRNTYAHVRKHHIAH
jgi:precorrin isomerase